MGKLMRSIKHGGGSITFIRAKAIKESYCNLCGKEIERGDQMCTILANKNQFPDSKIHSACGIPPAPFDKNDPDVWAAGQLAKSWEKAQAYEHWFADCSKNPVPKADFAEKCHKCSQKYCKKDCPALIEMQKMDTRLIKEWAKEHNRLHNQIGGEFRVFSLKCKHAGIIVNEILPRPGRCFHKDAGNYTQGCTNCYDDDCPLLNLTQ